MSTSRLHLTSSFVATLAMSLAATGGASSAVEDADASQPELTQTQSDALLSRSEAIGVYESVGVAPASIGAGYVHETVVIKADGKYGAERSLSSTPSGVTNSMRAATGTWKIPFLRFNQITLSQDANQALNGALAIGGTLLVDGERFKPHEGGDTTRAPTGHSWRARV